MLRRDFFRSMVSGLVLLAGSKLFAEEKRRGGGAGGAGKLEMVNPNDAAAKAVNYTANKSEIKKKELQMDRQGVPFAKQFCNSCGFYTADGANGKCTIFPNKLVAGQGWCASWNKKS